MSNSDEVTGETTNIWKHHISVPDTPEGFTVRTTFPINPDGAEVMLERWQAGSAEPPHSHPGDDMTVLVEGKMSVQFYTKSNNELIADGAEVILNKGDTGYVKAGRIHDAKYLEDCKLVYVHDKAFGFTAEN
ncbi:MAG: cupin domain-containing protein [Gammaproteobacteria bacterium]|nr:cupin domain-containing protein [Gammaproteobacteria bacterium]MCW8986596.1 cupin domain-containing protein [Gammaproteobacteria bacterium]MCW9029956.1 cupin domain-containing protein [Gammaproteobacteria bacterium]